MSDLETVVDDLALIRNHANPQHCLPGPCRVVKGEYHNRPATHQTYTSTPSLLRLLDDAITASIGGTTSGRSLAFERSILDTEALEQAAQISAALETWCHTANARFIRGDLSASLIGWRQAWNATHPTEAATGWYVSELGSWLRFILGKLNTPGKASIELPCPACGARIYQTADGNQDSWPIKLTWRKGEMESTARAECKACGIEWPSWGAITELRDEFSDRGQLDEAAHAASTSVRMALADTDECTEGVTRKGEFEPCGKTAVALRYDPEEGAPYPVCGFHSRADMVPLADIVKAFAVSVAA
jgi:hypothetical protein